MVGRSHGRTSALRKLQKLQHDLVAQQQQLPKVTNFAPDADAAISATVNQHAHNEFSDNSETNTNNIILTEPQEKQLNPEQPQEDSKARIISTTSAAFASAEGRKQLKGMVHKYTNFLRRNKKS